MKLFWIISGVSRPPFQLLQGVTNFLHFVTFLSINLINLQIKFQMLSLIRLMSIIIFFSQLPADNPLNQSQTSLGYLSLHQFCGICSCRDGQLNERRSKQLRGLKVQKSNTGPFSKTTGFVLSFSWDIFIQLLAIVVQTSKYSDKSGISATDRRSCWLMDAFSWFDSGKHHRACELFRYDVTIPPTHAGRIRRSPNVWQLCINGLDNLFHNNLFL